MDILHDPTSCPQRLQGAVLAIGNFDGVHRGHQAVLATAVDAARRRGAAAGVMIFEPHPREVFRPDVPLFRLTPLPMKLRLLEALGLDMAVVLTFDRALAGLEAADFVRTMLVERLAVAQAVTGYDFHFGKGRGGNPEVLRTLGAALGFEVTVVGPVADGGEPFSSSRVRAHLRQGEPEAAAHLLGYWWRFAGRVVAGDGRGHGLGFPTANIDLAGGVQLKHGIYAVRVWAEGERRYGAAYLGTRPTFGEAVPQAEVHLLGFDGDLYGREIEVELIAYLRGDEAFPSAQALKAQVQRDCRQAQAILDRIDADDPMLAYPLGAALSRGLAPART